jgi:hypothetical protein
LEAIALIMTKFSEELISAQLSAVFFVSAVAVYWLLIRKKKREGAEWVPAALVRAYLDRMQADERETRMKLFGEYSAAVSSGHAPLASALAPAAAVAGGGVDPHALKELEALRVQLSVSDQRAMEFDRMMNGLRAEKTALEQKLKDALTAAPGAATVAPADTAAATKELEDLRARLQEYEVIEDDLANLKKFQKENEQLRQKVETYEKGGAAVTAVAATPAATVAPTPVATPAPKEVKPVASEGPAPEPALTLVSGGAPPTPAPAAEPALEAPVAPEATAETNTNVLAPVTPTLDPAAPAAVAAAAPEKSSQQKEEELLSEFEKMLAS